MSNLFLQRVKKRNLKKSFVSDFIYAIMHVGAERIFISASEVIPALQNGIAVIQYRRGVFKAPLSLRRSSLMPTCGNVNGQSYLIASAVGGSIPFYAIDETEER